MGKLDRSSKSRSTTQRMLKFSRTPRNRSNQKSTDCSPDSEFYPVVRLLAELQALECLTDVKGVDITANRVRTIRGVSMCVQDNKNKRKAISNTQLDDKYCNKKARTVLSGTQDSNDMPRSMLSTLNSNDKPRSILSTLNSNDIEPRTILSKHDNNKKPRSILSTQDSNDKPRSILSTQDSNDKHRSMLSTQDSNDKPRSILSTQDSNDKHRSMLSTQDSNDKHRSIFSTQDSNDKPRSILSTLDSNDKPRSILSTLDSNDKPRSILSTQDINNKPRSILSSQDDKYCFKRPKTILSTQNGKLCRAHVSALQDNPRSRPTTSKETPKDIYYLTSLLHQLSACLDSNPVEGPRLRCLEDAEDPAFTPVYWISKWADYTPKYGLGYTLCDNSVGVLFNDQTRLVLHDDGENLQYIQKKGLETSYTMKHFPKQLEGKVKLIKFFNNYMKEHLMKAGGTQRAVQDIKPSPKSHLPYLRYWYRKTDSIVLHLSNGVLQINFFKDHTKIFLCPLKGSVTYIDKNKRMHTFPFQNLQKYGSSKEIHSRLDYAKHVIKELLKKLKEDSK